MHEMRPGLVWFVALVGAAACSDGRDGGLDAAVAPSTSSALGGAPVSPLVVERADARGFRVRFRPLVTESRVVLNGKSYDSLSVRGTAMPDSVGAPAVPTFTRPFALPTDATATATVVSVKMKPRSDRWLRPTPPKWEDEAIDPAVAESPAFYGPTAQAYPASLVAIRTGGAKLGGVRTGLLQLSTARFTPGSRAMELVEEIVVDVAFDRPFASTPMVHSLSGNAFANNFIINRGEVALDAGWNVPVLSSPELLIITTDALKPAADRLAAWKEQKGIDTWVISTSAIGTSASAIKSYIQSIYNAPLSHLRYLLVIGDVELVSTNYVSREVQGVTTAGAMASDLPYAQLDGNDAHADIAYGRISVDGLAQANTVVDKTLDYEQTPSFDAATYSHMTFSGYFQENSAYAALNMNGIVLTSRSVGGNNISLEIALPLWLQNQNHYAIDLAPTVSVTNSAIKVTLGTDHSGNLTLTTWLAIENLLKATANVTAIVTVTEDLDVDDDGTNEYTITLAAGARARQYLVGGKVHDGQEDKPYITVLEEIRDVMLTQGKTVERLYATNSTAGPDTFYDGTSLPADLLPASGFAWNATATDIQASFNAGRALVWHRDHGSLAGWAHPSFTTGDVDPLTNGDVDPADAYEDRYPVVFSINCGTGTFDRETDGSPPNDTESFAERILRTSDGGAVAVVAASRPSSTTYNQFLSQGLFDAYWGGVLGGFSPGAPSTLRLGDALVYAKDWVLANASSPSDPYVIDQIEMYHVHGDPTLELWTAAPRSFGGILSTWIEVQPNVFVYRVELTSAAETVPYLALWRGTTVASVGHIASSTNVAGGVTRVYEFTRPVGSDAATLYLTQPGYRPYIVGVGMPN